MNGKTFEFRTEVWDNLASRYNLKASFRAPLQNIADQYLNLNEAEQARSSPSEIKKRLLAVEDAARRLIFALDRLQAHDIAALTEPTYFAISDAGGNNDNMNRRRNLEILSQAAAAVLSLPPWCQSASRNLPKDKPGAHAKADLLRFLVLGFILAYEAEFCICFTRSKTERALLGTYVGVVDKSVTQSSLDGALLHVCEVDRSFPKLMRN